MKCLGNPDTGKPYVLFDAGQQAGVTNNFQEKPEALNFNPMIYNIKFSFRSGLFHFLD